MLEESEMTKQIEDGGPVFPVADTVHQHMGIQAGATGMSLRDWFVGQALAGRYCFGNKPEQIARDAYILADEILKARMCE